MLKHKSFIAVLCIVSALGGAAVSGFVISVSTDRITAQQATPDADRKFEARKNNWGPSEDF